MVTSGVESFMGGRVYAEYSSEIQVRLFDFYVSFDAQICI